LIELLAQQEIAMTEHKTTGQQLVQAAERGLLHIGAIIVGLILMIVGLAMGVSVVMLPVGIAVGIAGLFVFLWGIFGRVERASKTDETPQQ
jgi:hypothetical protein